MLLTFQTEAGGVTCGFVRISLLRTLSTYTAVWLAPARIPGSSVNSLEELQENYFSRRHELRFKKQLLNQRFAEKDSYRIFQMKMKSKKKTSDSIGTAYL